MARDCIFCRIVAGEIPSDQVASSELCVAFRDIQPAMPVHVLVVPRRHITSADTLQPADADILADMFATAQQVARQEGVADSGYRLVLNVGDDALNSVGHLHVHVLGGKKMGWPPG
ncbi:MAG TPA: histidine triad nucleotide-binding protein [Acidimicrobiales bacterium]